MEGWTVNTRFRMLPFIAYTSHNATSASHEYLNPIRLRRRSVIATSSMAMHNP